MSTDSRAYPSLATSILLSTAVVGTGAWLLLRKNKKQLPEGLIEAPAPPGHWLFGHIKQLTVPNYHKQFVKWADELGPVYRLWVGNPIVVVCDVSLAAPIMSRGPDYLPKSEEFFKQSLWLSFNHRSIVNQTDETDPAWRRIRKAAASCFAVEHIKKIFPQILVKADKMMSMWNKVLAPGPDGKAEGVVEAMGWTKRCIMDSMLTAAFKYDCDSLDDDLHNFDNEFIQVLHLLMEELSMRFVDPFRAPTQKLIPLLPSARQFNKLYARYRDMVETIWDTIQAKGPPQPDDHTLGAMLQRMMEPSADGPAFSKIQILGNLSIFLLASFDTSASAVSWALYNIASRPDVQQHCINELHDAGLLHVEGKPAPRPLAWEDLTAMPYLQATLKESMRYHTIVGGGTAREANRDMAIGKYWVPKGTVVWLPFTAFHESKHNFSEARTFDPTRWLASEQGKEEVTSGKAQSRPTPCGNAANIQKSFLPFGTGPRDCVGQSLANVTVRTMVMSILSRFHLSVHPDTGTPEEMDRDQILVLVTESGRPIKLIIKPHTQVPA